MAPENKPNEKAAGIAQPQPELGARFHSMRPKDDLVMLAGAHRILVEVGEKEQQKYGEKYLALVQNLVERLSSKPKKISTERGFFRRFLKETKKIGIAKTKENAVYIGQSLDSKQWNGANLACLAFDVGRVLGIENLNLATGPFSAHVTAQHYYLNTEVRKCRPIRCIRRENVYSITQDLNAAMSIGYRNVGLQAFRNSQYDIAITNLDASVALDPKNAEARGLLGLALAKSNDIESALRILEGGAEYRINSPFLVYALGEVHKQAGNDSKARIYRMALPLVSRKRTNPAWIYATAAVFALGFVVNYTIDWVKEVKNTPPTLEQKAEIVGTIAMDLKIENNLEFLARYPKGVIQDMISPRDTSRPLSIVFYPKSDDLGAFYNNRLEDIHEAGNQVIVVESQNSEKFISLVDKVRGEWGKSPLVVIGGHGNRIEILLGDGTLSKFDETPFIKLKEVLEPGAKIVLESCSTAEGFDNIARRISEVTGARVYAPDNPSYIVSFSFRKAEGTNEMVFEDVAYAHANRKIYDAGVLVAE